MARRVVLGHAVRLNSCSTARRVHDETQRIVDHFTTVTPTSDRGAREPVGPLIGGCVKRRSLGDRKGAGSYCPEAVLNLTTSSAGTRPRSLARAVGYLRKLGAAPAEVLARWRAASAANRRRFRERADGVVDTSIGDYPCRWQAIHVAAELATHADDIGVPVTPGEHGQRTAWRAWYSRFALAEAKPQLEIRHAAARTTVTGGPATVELDDDELIEAVMGRLDQTSGFSAALRALVSMMP